MNPEELLRLDRHHLWHPYASMTQPTPTLPVVAADGVRLELADGRKLIDGMASWWSAIHGYNHPALNQAAHRQLDAMSHVMFGGLTHPPAVTLAERLLALLPTGLECVFPCDSGSVAVEVAMKMALQFWAVSGSPRRRQFLTVRNGYHGDTLHAMSVCDPITGMHRLFQGALPPQVFAEAPPLGFDRPWQKGDMDSFARLLDEHAATLAAVILEPIVQGAGGMRFYAPRYLQQVRKLAKDAGILLILDEIATGFGRTGKMFAAEHAEITPDIMCVGKALTGGYMTLGATIATRAVAERVSGNGQVLMHGPTFMGNPLACAVARASIDALTQSPWQRNVKRIERELASGLAPSRELPHVVDVRALGAIGVIELDEPVSLNAYQRAFVDRGVWVRPFGKLVYVMPPYIIQPSELAVLTTAMVDVVKANPK
ncbi:MAG: adenosylmethionine--8-amino-7-oxononanoate transaminase [Planctomycetota bacterium]